MGQDGSPRRKLLTWRPPLSVRLAAVAVCLLAAGAGIIVVAGGLATRNHLTRQAGQQLRGYAGQLARHPFLLTPLSRTPPGPPGLSDLAAAGAGALSLEVRGAGGQLVIRAGPGRPAGPGPQVATARVLAGQHQAATVRASRGRSYLSIAEPIRYRAHRIPYAYGAEDFALDVTSPAGTGSPGTLVVSLSLARISQATGRLTVIMLAVSGLVVLAAGCVGAWIIGALRRPLTQALGATLAQVEEARLEQARFEEARFEEAQARQAGGGATAAGPAGRHAAGWREQAIADTGRALRTPLSVLGALTEYYWHRDQLSPADCDRLLARVADETTRIGMLIDALERAGPDQPGPPGPGENVGRGA